MYYNKRITTRDNGNVVSHGQEESKLNSTINANTGPHYDIIIKSLFNKNDVATINNNLNSNKDLIIRACRIRTIPANIYLLVNNRNTRCEICSKLTIKTPERRQCFYC